MSEAMPQKAVVNGLELEYTVRGSGRQVVWLHGLGGNLALEEPVSHALSKDFEVLTFSSRGHGRSQPPAHDTGFRYAEFAKDLDGLLDVVGFDRPMLVGGSHGANTILRHSVDFPGRARAAVLIAPGANALRRPPALPLAMVLLALRRARRKGPDGLLQFITGLDPAAAGADEQTVSAARTHDPQTLYRTLRHTPTHPALDAERLREIAMPVIVAAWDKDPVVHPIALARRIAHAIPGAQFEQIQSMIGASPGEVAAEIARKVEQWWSLLEQDAIQ